MFGWLSPAAVVISEINRAVPIEAAISGLMTFTATRRLCLRSRALYTVAIPPRPISFSIAYADPISGGVSKPLVNDVSAGMAPSYSSSSNPATEGRTLIRPLISVD